MTRPAALKVHGGAALLAAMLTVALVATLAAAALWQQWRGVAVEEAERARVQSAWVLVGALDWARLILREDARSGGADHLDEPWAVPLAEARLSSFLGARDAAASDDTLQAFLSGRITDQQGLLNLTNLIDASLPAEPALAAWSRLFRLLDLPPAELSLLVSQLRRAHQTNPDPDAPLPPQRLDDLRWLGLGPATIERLRPYATLLPTTTPVNLNTAGAEVLHATIAGLELADARRLVQLRQASHFTSLADAAARLPVLRGRLDESRHAVASRFFEVQGRLRLDKSVLQERALVQRTGIDVKALWRERSAALLDPDGPSAGPPAATDRLSTIGAE